MIHYRNMYKGQTGAAWRTPETATWARLDADVGEDLLGCGSFLRVETLFNGIPFRPPVGLTKREPTFLIRTPEGDWYQAYGEGTSQRIEDAYEYTAEELSARRPSWRYWPRGMEIIAADLAFEKYAGGL